MSDEPGRALPVLRTVGQAHLIVLRRRRRFLIAAVLPVLLMAGIFFLRETMPALYYRLDHVIIIALHAFPLVLFSLHWLRRMPALSPASDPARRPVNRTAARFAIVGLPAFLTLLLSPYLAVLLVVLTVQIGCWLTGASRLPEDAPLTSIFTLWGGLLVIWYLLAGRLLPCLAAIAQQADVSLQEIWRRTRGEGRRITGALLLVSLSAFLITAVVFLAGGAMGSLMAGTGSGALEDLILPAFVIVFALVATALISSVLDLAHRHLYEGPGGPAKEILAAFD